MVILADSVKLALANMEALCSRREYCISDIKRKLERYALPDGAVEEIIVALKSNKYLDDARYAIAYARDKSSLAGWGPKKITFSLRGKGISPDVINMALEEIDSSKATERMEEILLRKWKSLSKEDDLEKKRVKTIKFAMGRGYPYDEVNSFVRTLK